MQRAAITLLLKSPGAAPIPPQDMGIATVITGIFTPLSWPVRLLTDRVRFLRAMPAQPANPLSRVEILASVGHVVVTVAALSSFLYWGDLTWSWAIPFFIAALRFDQIMAFSQTGQNNQYFGEAPFVLVAAVVLAPAQLALVILVAMALSSVFGCTNRVGLITGASNSLMATSALVCSQAALHLIPHGGSVSHVVIVMVGGWIGYIVGPSLLFCDLALTQGMRAWGAFIKDVVLSREELVGNAGHVANALPAALAYSIAEPVIALMFVPYLVVWNTMRTTEQLAVAERKIGVDALTGLANRERFNEHVAAEVRAAGKFDGSLALVMGDLDNFKRVNDQIGHLAGDEVLRRTAAIWTAATSADDRLLIARYGGEEFALVASAMDRDELLALIEDVRERVYVALHEEFGTSISLGMAYWDQGQDVETWIDRADKALYSAKFAGKNRTHEFPLRGSGIVCAVTGEPSSRADVADAA